MKRSLALVCFVLSGSAGLLYEICWIRMSSLAFGATTQALSTVLAVFFGGLALGSWILGRFGQRTTRPLRLYGLLEITLAGLALLTIPAFSLLDGVYGAVYRAAGTGSAWPSTVRLMLVALLLLPPSFVMGGTLPLFCRQFVQRRSGIARSVGFLYGINTLGAALGCAAAGLWLLPAIGLRATIMLGALLSTTAGAVTASLKLQAAPASEPVGGRQRLAAAGSMADPDPAVARSSSMATVGPLFFAIGLAALGSEVLWSRFLALILHNTVYTYTITLMVVLVGIVLGSLVASRLFDGRLPRALTFGALQALTGLVVLTLMLLPVAFWRGLGRGPAPFIVLMLLPALLSGASFPLGIRMVLAEPALAAAGVGSLTALNTLGGIVGSLATGFLLLPRWGLQTSLLVLTGISILIAGLAWLRLERRLALGGRWALAGACVLAWLALPRLIDTRLPADYLAPPQQLVAYREGLSSNLAVVDRKGALQLEIDRLWQGENRKNHQILAAHVPLLFHAAPKRVVVVGVGTGQTASRFLMYDIERLSCVDIEPALFPFIAAHFPSGWLRDPRVQLISEDGRNYLRHTDEKFDLVSIEVGQVFRPGAASFYTLDFYREAAKRLRGDHALIVQFVPLSFLTAQEFRSVVRTFLAVFPRSVLWYNGTELLLIGSAGDPPALLPRRLALVQQDDAINEDLHYSHWGGPGQSLHRPEALLSGFLCGPDDLAALAAAGQIYRDDRPTLAYATSAVVPESRLEEQDVRLLQEHLTPLAELPGTMLRDSLLARAKELRERNLEDIVATGYLRLASGRQGKRDLPGALALVRQALQWNDENVFANSMLGDLLTFAGNPAGAKLAYKHALAIDPRHADAMRGLGYILLDQRQMEAAAEWLERVLDQRPDDAAAHNYLGVTYASRGRYPEALTHFREAVRLRPWDESARQNLARAQHDLSVHGGRSRSVR